MQNSLSLSTKPKAVAKALEGCEVGKPKTITLEVVPTRNSEGVFEAKIQRIVSVDYGDDEEDREEEEVSVKGSDY